MKNTGEARSVFSRFWSTKWLVLMMAAWGAGCGQGGSKQKSAPGTGEIEATKQAVTGAFCAGVSASFCDDFQDGNATSPAWTVRDQAVASDFNVVTDGDYVYKQGDSGTTNTRRISTSGTGWDHVMVEAQIKVLSFKSNTANWVGLYARYNTTSNTGYALALGGDGKISLRKKTTGSDGTCISATYPASGCSQTVSPVIALNTWYTLKFVLNGSTLTGYLNGTRVIEGTDTTYTTGVIGVGSTGGSTFEADEVAVNRVMGTCDAGFGVPKAAGTVCRAAAGACDKAETCDGTSLTCPTDGLQPAGTVCRAASGPCDVPETCTGSSVTCPAEVETCSSGCWAFCDNFESGTSSKWTVKQGNTSDFSVVTDSTKVYKEGAATASTWHVSQAGKAWLSQTVEAKLKPLSFSSSSAYVALFGRYEVSSTGDCAYYAALRGDGKVALGKRLNGVDSVLGTPVASGIAAGTWYAVKLDLQGSTIDVYLNGTKILTQTDASCEVGSVGVASLGASFESDEVRVTAPTSNSCVQGWRGNTCGDYCKSQTQSDKIHCADFLDCYANNACSPESCGGQDDVCGVNHSGLNSWGTAPKVVADQVYKCMGCAGSVNCGAARKPDSTACADGNACTTYDSCQGGVCVGASPVTCYAKDQCHNVGTCSPSTGVCSDPNKTDGTACNDGNGCTASDVCTAGTCGGTAYSCDDGLACTADVCNGDGTCGHTIAADSCAINGTCYVAGAVNPDNQCQQCAPTTSQTAWSPKPAGTGCNDGNACTKNDVCNGTGTCSGTAYTCNDGLACTVDTCNGDGSCSFTLLPGNCAIDGVCFADGTPRPNNPCQQCASMASATSWSPKADGTVCSDGNACTKNDVCTAGTCAGTAYACDDGLDCTADSCNGDGSCSHTLVVGSCLIAGACYAAGAANLANACQVCNPSQATVWSTQADGTACDDGNPCTETDTCKTGVCAGTNRACGGQCGYNRVCDDVGTCVSVADPTDCTLGDDAHPKPTEVIVWEGDKFSGTCRTLVSDGSTLTRYLPADFSPVVNDSISSVKVGCGVRAVLFKDASFAGGVLRATYEAGSSHHARADWMHDGYYLSGLGRYVGAIPADQIDAQPPQTSAIIVEPEDGRRVAYSYIDESPSDSETTAFSYQPQGIAHSPTHWFFTNTWMLMKIPVESNLDYGFIDGATCVPELYKDGYEATPECVHGTFPHPATGEEGCGHMGDLDYATDPNDTATGYVFVPLEKCDPVGGSSSEGIAKVAAYRPDDLSLVGSSFSGDGIAGRTPRTTQVHGGFLAIDPITHHLWTSDEDWVMRRYEIKWDSLKGHQAGQPPVDFLKPVVCPTSCSNSDNPDPNCCSNSDDPKYRDDPNCPRDCSWHYVRDPAVLGADGEPSKILAGGQGAVFDQPSGGILPQGRILYLSESGDSPYHGIMAVNPENGLLLAKTGDNYGPFNFQREYPIDQEEEGIDYFDLSGRPEVPGAGELHALLNFNAISDYNGNVSIKHYTAWPERYCHTPGEHEATLWSEANFSGFCRTLPVGKYPEHQWTFPIRNDWTSSLQVGSGAQAAVFENDFFDGRSITVRGNAVNTCDPAEDSGAKGTISNFAACGWGSMVTSVIVKDLSSLTPQSAAPLTPLAGLGFKGIQQHVEYVNAAGDICELYSVTTPDLWDFMDLTQQTGAPALVKESGIVAFESAYGDDQQHIVYKSAGSGHDIFELMFSNATQSWMVNDLSASAANNGPVLAPKDGTALTGYQTDYNQQLHVDYIGSDGYPYELWYDTSHGPDWHANGLYDSAGTPLAQRVGAVNLVGYQSYGSRQHVVMIGEDHKIYEFYLNQGQTSWTWHQLPAVAVVANSALHAYVTTTTSPPQQHINFIATDPGDNLPHLFELVIGQGQSNWTLNDLDKGRLPAGTSVLPSSPLGGYETTNNSQQHVNFVDSQNHVWELVYGNGFTGWTPNDLTGQAIDNITGAPVPLTAGGGSHLVAYQGTDSLEHVVFVTDSNDVYELYFSNNQWLGNNLSQNAAQPCQILPQLGCQ